MTDGSQTPPGWYPDPQDPTALRWWNGLGWTDDRRPAAAAAPASSAPSYPNAPAAGYAPYPNAAPAAPAATPVRRDIPTDTPWIWLVVLLPILTVLPLLFVDWRGYIEDSIRAAVDEAPGEIIAASFPAWLLVLTLLSYVVVAAQVVFAYLDWRVLKARGIDRPFHWAWIFFTLVITNGVYVIGRGVVLRRQTGKGLGPVWAWIAVNVALILAGIIFSVYLVTETFSLIEQYDPGVFAP